MKDKLQTLVYASIAHGERSFLISTMDHKCGKCSCAIGDAEYIYCDGFCGATCKFHAQCTGLTDAELEACNNNNVFWMCERCRFLLENARFRSVINSLDAVHYFQQKEYNKTIDDLKATISHLNDSVSSLLELKKLENESICKTDTPANSDAPLSSTRIVDPAETHTEQRNESFKLFLSNIDPNVTEADISELVSARVGTPKPFSVKRLVPAWRHLGDVEYISFKIELDASERGKALSSGTWPPGMRYREFRDRTRDVPWSPRQYGSLRRHNENTI